MGLYGERIGSLTVITSDPRTTKKVDSQLKAVSTLIYSNLPASHVSFMHIALVPVHWPRKLPCSFVLPFNKCCIHISIKWLVISNEAPASCFQQMADYLAIVQVIRPMYSNPPRHGAAIVTAILSDPELYSQWKVSTFGVQH